MGKAPVYMPLNKDLKMRSSRIVGADPELSDKCPFERRGRVRTESSLEPHT